MPLCRFVVLALEAFGLTDAATPMYHARHRAARTSGAACPALCGLALPHGAQARRETLPFRAALSAYGKHF